MWHRCGGRSAIVSGRNTPAVTRRARDLGIEFVAQAAGDKLSAYRTVLETFDAIDRQACYVGDDLTDIPVVQFVGLGVAVADAAEEVRSRADYVTEHGGGQGAVRETIELVLKAQKRWNDLIQKYVG